MRFFSCATLILLSAATTPLQGSITDAQVDFPPTPAIIEVAPPAARAKKLQKVSRVEEAMRYLFYGSIVAYVACMNGRVKDNSKGFCGWLDEKSESLFKNLEENIIGSVVTFAVGDFLFKDVEKAIDMIVPPVYEEVEVDPDEPTDATAKPAKKL